MRTSLRSVLGGVVLFLASGNLLTAGTIGFNLNSVTFTDGGSATGSFVWDNVGETLVSWSISTTAGTQQPTPFTYSDAIAGQGQIAIGNAGIYLLGAEGAQQLNLNFTGSLDSGSPLSFYYNNSREYNTFAPDFGRNVASGSISASAVPEPTTSALLGFGLVALVACYRRAARSPFCQRRIG